jgi:hypothetical protein
MTIGATRRSDRFADMGRRSQRWAMGLLSGYLLGGFIALVTLAAHAIDEPKPYYFSEGALCTLMVDFQPSRARVESLGAEERQTSLIREMIRVFQQSGQAQCSAAGRVRLVAVFIPGLDNYGRPNFASRQNIVRADGPVSAIATIPDQASFADLSKVFDIQPF